MMARSCLPHQSSVSLASKPPKVLSEFEDMKMERRWGASQP